MPFRCRLVRLVVECLEIDPWIPIPHASPVWLTRDRFEGVLSSEVDVWVYRPKAERLKDGDVLWLAPLDVVDRRATYWGAMTVDEARRRWGRAVPESAEELVCVGG